MTTKTGAVTTETAAAGDVIGPLRVGAIAHGGHCVTRYEGRVVFVRHVLPGELARVRLTDTSRDRFWRGDGIEVLEASPDRVVPTCPVAGPGGCGGCDFQHVGPDAQRRLKAAVIAEQLERLAGVHREVTVEEVPHPEVNDGRGWRTRMQWVADAAGRPGLRVHRSHEVAVPPARSSPRVGPGGCELASPRTPDPTGGVWPPEADVLAVGAADGGVLVSGEDQGRTVTEHAAGRDWQVAATGFWQVHPAAADTLARTVVELVAPRAGERAFDLYCGVGLFTGALTDCGVRVWGVESDAAAVRHARDNLAGTPARFTAGRVERVLRRLPRRTDLIVLDPPRSGAGRQVVTQAAERRPRAIVYVACDPAALARDVATFADRGYRLDDLRAYDLFPMTHHVECVALLRPGGMSMDRPPTA